MAEEKWTAQAVLRLLQGSSGQEQPQAATAERLAQMVTPGAEIPSEVVEALKQLFPPAGSASGQPATAQERPTPVPSPLRLAFRRSAAVLAACDPARLRPLHMDAPPGAALSELVGDLVPAYVTTDLSDLWMLRPEIRRQTLHQLGDRAALVGALEANPDRLDNPLQRTLEEQIRGTAKRLEGQSLDELTRTLQAVRWLQATELSLPDTAYIQRLMEERRVLAVFEQLTANFVGRTDDLRRLRDYVGVLEPSGAIEGVRRTFRRWFDQHEKPPLAFYAEGGAGKSTLIARFLLDHARVPEEQRFPYVYLDFDHPTVVAGEPATLLREAARQLAVQYPLGRQALEAFVVEAQDAAQYTGPDRSLGAGGLEVARQSALDERRYDQLHKRFARLVRDIVRREDDLGEYLLPLLVVVDTYEEVQNRGIEHELRLWNLLEALRADFRSLRVVVFGRGPLERVPTTEQTLKPRLLEELDTPAAEALLRREGVKDQAAIETLCREVGGNPLSLKLAAQVYRSEREASSDRTGVERLERTRLVFFSAAESVVQGQLYQRILRHIRSPDVRRLAHPGLVLRRVTPGLIKEVLQEPCGVSVPTYERAEELFEALKREVALVTVEPDGALRHRSDVRRVMLKLIQRDKPEQVTEINRLAVRYYERHPELSSPTQARAEELYHRLQLEQAPDEIERRWMDGVAEYLRGALAEDELPVASQPVLASLLGIRVSDKVIAAADMERWERYTARVAEESIAKGRYEAALRALNERSRRRWSPGSPLHLLEARTDVLLHRFDRAEAAYGRALTAAGRSRSRHQMLETLLLGAQLADEQDDRSTADDRLDRAEQLSVVLNDPIRQLEIALRRLRLREAASSAVADDPDLRLRLAQLLTSLPDEAWHSHESLIRQSVLGLGFERPDLLLRLVQQLGAGHPNKAQLARLAELLAELVQRDDKALRRTQTFARTLKLPAPDTSPSSMEHLLRDLQAGDRLSELFEQLIPLIAANSESRRAGSELLPHLFAEPPDEERA